MRIEINVHSFVDLITNSSTEMFIDYSDSVEPCKRMIDEMFKTAGIYKTCDDVFNVFLENEDDECTPATIVIETKDPGYDNLAKSIKAFLESGESKEFLS